MKINEAYFLISGIQTHHNIHTAPDSQGQARLGTGLGGSAFCMARIDVPEQAVGWFPVGLELTVKDRSSKMYHTFELAGVKEGAEAVVDVGRGTCDVISRQSSHEVPHGT